MIHGWNFLEAFSSITTSLWYVCRRLHMFLALFPVLISVWRAGFRGDLFQLISKWLESVGWLSRTSGSTAPPHFTKVLPKITHDENNENKLNKHGLLLNPIVIGTRLCRTSMWSLRKVSGCLYMANHVFLACRVPWVSPMATGVTINH